MLLLAVVAVGAFFAGAPTAMAANPSANLDQCGNDPRPSPSSDGCDSTVLVQWVNGNLGASKSFYREGDSIPYRLTFSNLSMPGPHAVTIEWDTTKSSKHAIDYVDNYNQSVLDANPCQGISGCGLGSFAPQLSPAIPADPQVTGAGVTPIPGNFVIYGGSITSFTRPSKVGNTTCTNANSSGSYCYSTGSGFSGDKSAAITVNFTASVPNPVIAWGGHISTRADWGLTASAVNIPGSPYHTRLIDLDGAGGNQDRSLSAEAVVFPGQITIIKDAVPNSTTSFPFSDTGPEMTPSTFSLVDNGVVGPDRQVFSNLLTFGSGSTRTVTETQPPPAHWSLTNITCSVSPSGSGTASGNTTTGVSTINLNEGDFATCTYTNTHQVNTPTVSTTLSNLGPISIGTSVHDSATISGATSDAGGTISYKIYSDNTCSTLVADVTPNPNTVSGGLAPDSNSHQFNSAGTFYWQATYSGDGNNTGPVSSSCTSETLVVNAPDVASLQPTATTCTQFLQGTNQPITQIQYSVKGNPSKINQTNPGVFFYFVQLSFSSAGSKTVHVTQANTTPNQVLASPLFAIQSIQVFSFVPGTTTCSNVSLTGSSTGNPADASATFNASTTLNYVVAVKYSTSSIAGSLAPNPTTQRYTYATVNVAGSSQSLNLVKK